VLLRLCDIRIYFMKRIESMLKIVSMKVEFLNLEIHFHKHQVSFPVAKTIKCKHSINFKKMALKI